MAKKSKRKKAATAGTPTCNCLVLCDDVVVSHGRDKHNLMGIIGTLAFPALPAITGGFVAYVRLSNVHTQQRVTVGLEEAESEAPLWEFAAELVNRNDPLAVHTLVTKVPPFRIERPGRYLLKAKHNGVPLAQTPIIVVSAQPAGEERA